MMNTIRLHLGLVLSTALICISSISFANQSWNFRVFLDDQEIGEHSFRLTSLNDHTHVEIRADFDVYFLFINAYSYKHTNYEVWNGNCLQSIRSSTDDNGSEVQVYGEVKNNLLQLSTSTGQQQAEGCIKTFAYWDPSFLQSKILLNAQTGELMPVNVSYIGEESILVRNEPTKSKRYQLKTDEFTIDLWYSSNNEWLALNSTTRDGYTLRYQIQ